MPKVYEFSGFPRRMGILVGRDESLSKAAKEALISFGGDEVTEHNVGAYLSSGQLKLAREFPDTDEGWDEAFDYAYNLLEY